MAKSANWRAELWSVAGASALSLWREALSGDGEPHEWAFPPAEDDARFRHPGWSHAPFNHLAEAQLAAERLWRLAIEATPNLPEASRRRMGFLGAFALNAMAPLNFPWTNPQVIQAAWRTGGANFAAGAAQLFDDLARLSKGERLRGVERFELGATLAATPGEVIYRNRLMELIQYGPSTSQARRQPVLLVPAWLMKYYALDLAPDASLAQLLVEHGFTVFVVSWKNPGSDLAGTSLEDYRVDGLMTALDVISEVVPQEQVHAVGYCLGGVLLAAAAAAMARSDDRRLATLSFFASHLDFDEPGEMMMFMDESQIALLEDAMQERGYLDAREMAGAFYALRTHEMVFQTLVERYLVGEPRPPGPIDAWLADPTRVPARAHKDYLRNLFQANALAEGTYDAACEPVGLGDIDVPVFVLACERDHIAPWRSACRARFDASPEITRVLTGGGHISGVISPPGTAEGYYRLRPAKAQGGPADPAEWLEASPKQPGSWQPAWIDWLEARSAAEFVAPPSMGRADVGLTPLTPAPGLYVREA
ncbi:MAG: alpha/beta fold hydrolase [Caulobacteraceae bacterium]|nr:alpha/beta fold hydrolase [Caulobacteraceae bacterium]